MKTAFTDDNFFMRDCQFLTSCRTILVLHPSRKFCHIFKWYWKWSRVLSTICYGTILHWKDK